MGNQRESIGPEPLRIPWAIGIGSRVAFLSQPNHKRVVQAWVDSWVEVAFGFSFGDQYSTFVLFLELQHSVRDMSMDAIGKTPSKRMCIVLRQIWTAHFQGCFSPKRSPPMESNVLGTGPCLWPEAGHTCKHPMQDHGESEVLIRSFVFGDHRGC